MDEKKDQKPKLLFMLTTSNHRPFTYPEGKIDIPSGESRAGAVKYTDYAIGKFLTESKSKPWFRDTLFVIIADHSTEGRGQFDLEMADFHIPMWIYAPGVLKSRIVDRLKSQIDLLPSLIDLLDLKDESPFFGKSFLNENWNEDRAFVGNYQYVGYYRDRVLTTLGPNRAVRSFSFDPVTKKQKDMKDSPYAQEAAAFYQYASSLLETGHYHVPAQ
jgi:phosphoglycerol transferase MdoB-like AlkP superfamily enzyme